MDLTTILSQLATTLTTDGTNVTNAATAVTTAQGDLTKAQQAVTQSTSDLTQAQKKLQDDVTAGKAQLDLYLNSILNPPAPNTTPVTTHRMKFGDTPTPFPIPTPAPFNGAILAEFAALLQAAAGNQFLQELLLALLTHYLPPVALQSVMRIAKAV